MLVKQNRSFVSPQAAWTFDQAAGGLRLLVLAKSEAGQSKAGHCVV
ncbi:TPA: hypothetical protein TVN94_001254 [Streptococcus equi subsp. zooepidemicus]|nr:hypothetical protein [Streptococcus equi]HEL1289309.1 hypothetical protein [Streptococcus equi subsp. zooepidemicus]